MIGFPRRLLVDHVLAPQGDEALGERRAFLADVEPEIGVEAQELDLLGLTTRPLAYEIGGGVELRHEISVAVAVQHGDRAEARRLRDRIVLDLCLRAIDASSELANEVDPDVAGHYLTAIRWAVDWRPLTLDDTNETATVTFTIDTQLDR